MRVCPLRMKMTNTQKMNCFETSTQNIPNLHVCSLESSESKRIKANKSLLHVYSTEKKNQKGLLYMNVLWTKANQKELI